MTTITSAFMAPPSVVVAIGCNRERHLRTVFDAFAYGLYRSTGLSRRHQRALASRLTGAKEEA
jgi:hypothetical protein